MNIIIDATIGILVILSACCIPWAFFSDNHAQVLTVFGSLCSLSIVVVQARDSLNGLINRLTSCCRKRITQEPIPDNTHDIEERAKI